MPTEKLYMSPIAFRAGDFDASKRYLREGNTLSNFPVVRGRTIDIGLARPSNYNIATVRFSVNGYAWRTNYTHEPSPGVFIQVQGSGFNANISLVTT